ncbi:MAG: methylmalonyl-CoA epimerase [Bacteroidota bacterium]|jgi:methylmalonyl-CoA/ethylmalonyl-CoA epimerase
MITSINHIGIAVKELPASIELFKKIFQFESIHQEIVENQKVNVASFKVGDVLIELTSPSDENSPIAKFIEKHGEGIHHIGFNSDNVSNELERLSEEGINLINTVPVEGANDMLIAFLHPKSTNGVLTEICQKK